MAAILDLPEMRARVHRWTVAEYEKLGDDPAFRRSELIRGIIIEKMSKSPLHSTITLKLFSFFLQTVGEGYIIRPEQPLRLMDSMPEPDIAVMRGTLDDFATRHPESAELVVEVAVSSVAPDLENASIYAEAGIAEYWIVLGESEAVEVYRRPEDGTYQEKRTYKIGESISDVGVVGESVPVDVCFGL